MRAGKDTFAEQFIPVAASLGHNYRRVGFADVLKEEVATELGITLDELILNKDRYREKLIAHGALRRAQDEMYWVKRAIPEEGNIIITDLRFRNEYDYLACPELHPDGLSKTYFIRVESLSTFRSKRGKVIDNDPSETELDNGVLWDQIIYNNGSPISKEVLRSQER
jgi:phosphomevalonate kinase